MKMHTLKTALLLSIYQHKNNRIACLCTFRLSILQYSKLKEIAL